jgi:hypothetical protein
VGGTLPESMGPKLACRLERLRSGMLKLNVKVVSRYTRGWQEDRAVAAGNLCASEGYRGRKVRTPEGGVPDNVRDAGFKTRGRPVPQKRYRPGYPSSEGIPERLNGFARRASPRRGKGEMVR